MSGLSIFPPSSGTEGPTYFPAALGEEPFDFAYFGPGSIPSDVVWRGRLAQGRFQKSTENDRRSGTYRNVYGTYRNVTVSGIQGPGPTWRENIVCQRPGPELGPDQNPNRAKELKKTIGLRERIGTYTERMGTQR